MAGRLVVGRNGQVKCPACGREFRYELWDWGIGADGRQWDMLILSNDNACSHAMNAEWFVQDDGSVEFVFHDIEEGEQ
jgi:phage terminase large subunit GpA-like protein